MTAVEEFPHLEEPVFEPEGYLQSSGRSSADIAPEELLKLAATANTIENITLQRLFDDGIIDEDLVVRIKIAFNASRDDFIHENLDRNMP